MEKNIHIQIYGNSFHFNLASLWFNPSGIWFQFKTVVYNFIYFWHDKKLKPYLEKICCCKVQYIDRNQNTKMRWRYENDMRLIKKGKVRYVVIEKSYSVYCWCLFPSTGKYEMVSQRKIYSLINQPILFCLAPIRGRFCLAPIRGRFCLAPIISRFCLAWLHFT